MSFDAPHIMLLDEPTNHLDIDAREALTRALNEYEGAVILVSHDPHLVECVADRLWLVADHTCKPYDGDLDDYRELVVRQRRQEREKEKQKNKTGADPKPESKKLSQAEKEVAKIEQKIEALTLEKDAMENEIANVCASGDTHPLKDLNITYAQLEKKLAQLQAELNALIAKL
jgi:ATP-binding cassette subfamily F protein 3